MGAAEAPGERRAKPDAIEDVLLLCEHPHVITLGRNGKRENLLASEQVLRQKNVEFHASDRGGDITYHGPGQIVGYPILNLGAIRKDVVLVRAHAGRGHDPHHGGFRDCGGTGGGKNGHLGARSAERCGRKTGSDRSTSQPLGDFARLRLQRVDGLAVF